MIFGYVYKGLYFALMHKCINLNLNFTRGDVTGEFGQLRPMPKFMAGQLRPMPKFMA